ncbi:hypothetical protein EW146_g9583 [Bondarzewia mesenterica]|uniref:XLF-like N-terminal domain-containing protein n=1 Tax=Bondarzewia mesenterica TaxID=1095465 RepID=A0A4S4L594_9AGAM|nr:hypothetical protein EW146_g9583 [Bondarzewia mesenterica]
MEYFSEEHSKLLLSKEWLVKVDNEKSVPYLMKFYASPADLSCSIMITDTKIVWAEVLSSKQVSRRWHNCNESPTSAYSIYDAEQEQEWTEKIIVLLSDAHTLGGINELSFGVVESRYSDFAFELHSDEVKWRWETFLLGPTVSAEILSKHLILPLISTVHLAFTSADSVGELSESNLEKAVDKVGRTARRTLDTHLRNAIGRPRVATTLRRISALFDFSASLPAVLSDVENPDLKAPSPPLGLRLPISPARRPSETPPRVHGQGESAGQPETKGQEPSPPINPVIVGGGEEYKGQERIPKQNTQTQSSSSQTRSQSQLQTQSQRQRQQQGDEGSVTDSETEDDESPAPAPTPSLEGRSAGSTDKAKAEAHSPSPNSPPVHASPPASMRPSGSPAERGATRGNAASKTSKPLSSDSDSPPRPKKKVKGAPPVEDAAQGSLSIGGGASDAY